jgi:nucleoid DNA-binding protein
MIELSVASSLLRQLLRTHNRVSLPGVGAFLVDSTPANFIKGGKAILPPSKNITFSVAETWNDGLLEQALARDQGYTPEGAQKQVAAFSQKLIELLTAGRRIEFPELGIMRITADGEWRFTPFETVDVDADSFGLLELEVTPIAPEPPAPFRPATPPPSLPYTPPPPAPLSSPPPLSRPPAPPAEPSRRPCCSVACWILIVLLLLVVGGYVFRRPIANYIETSYYTPEQLAYLRGESATAETPVTTPPPVTAPAPVPVAEPETTIKPKPAPHTSADKGRTRPTNRFHIFLARFDEESEAQDYAKHLESMDYSAKVIHTGHNTYKVSVLHYSSKQEAETILTGLKDTDNSEFRNAWVEKY